MLQKLLREVNTNIRRLLENIRACRLINTISLAYLACSVRLCF